MSTRIWLFGMTLAWTGLAGAQAPTDVPAFVAAVERAPVAQSPPAEAPEDGLPAFLDAAPAAFQFPADRDALRASRWPRGHPEPSDFCLVPGL